MLKKSDWWNTLKNTSLHPTRLRSTWLQFVDLICYSFTFRNAAKEAKREKGQDPGPFAHFFGVRNFAGV